MLRVGLVCDFRAEKWVSMDHVAERLFSGLRAQHATNVQVERLEPHFRRLATRITPLRSYRHAVNMDRFANRMLHYPAWLGKHKNRFDLFHIVDHSYAHLALSLPSDRTIVTCHDLDTFRCLFDPADDPRPAWFQSIARRILKGLQSARHVIFVSDTVRNQANELGIIPLSHSSTNPNGAHCDTTTACIRSGTTLKLPASFADKLLLLSVGSNVPRKRLDVLLRIFAGAVATNPDLRLVRVGDAMNSSQAALTRELGIQDKIVQMPFLERRALESLYRKATLLLQPSDAEGFALPMAEALACGCPVLASDIPALRETGGDAAVYAPVGNVAAWVDVLNTVLSSRSNLPFWSDLRQRSLRNAERFSWSKNVSHVVSVYSNVMTSHAEGRA